MMKADVELQISEEGWAILGSHPLEPGTECVVTTGGGPIRLILCFCDRESRTLGFLVPIDQVARSG